jgi:GR25 family glycosyltransferase involved in LPS biosynthesis
MMGMCGFSDIEYEIIEAVYGKELSLTPTMELYKIFEENDFGSRCGFIGCALSHYGLWMELLRDTTRDYYVIIEDDVVLCNRYKEQIHNMESHFKDKDIVYHGYTMYKDIRANTKHIYDYSIVNSTTNVCVCPLTKEYYVGGTFGYSINKNGARKMIDYIHKHGIKHGIDYVMKIVNTVECYETQPNLCFSLWHEDNTEYDTDIQKYHDSFDFSVYQNYYLQILQDNFTFIPLRDQIGHDLYHKHDTLKNMVLGAICDKNCVAFNTLGFFKSSAINITTSSWFGGEDGIYIKKDYMYKNREKLSREIIVHPDSLVLGETKTHETIQVGEINDNSDKSEIIIKKRVKMLCNWCSSKDLCYEFSKMNNYGGFRENNSIELVYDNENIDYYVIINMPTYDTAEFYDPSKTIIFQMEPWVYDNTKNWGVKTWGEWAIPDPNKFMKVFRHIDHLNNVQWQVPPPEQITGDEKINKVISILSGKKHDEGHKKRVDFLKHIENVLQNVDMKMDVDNIHVYGRENYHDLKSYVGETDNKRELVRYKYCFSCENNSEKNYATEKIWEPILFECLCFYWGCPNLEDHIDPRAFVRLPLDNFDECVSIIRQAIEEDWWSQRIDIIKKEKQKILNELGFFSRLHKLITPLNI